MRALTLEHPSRSSDLPQEQIAPSSRATDFHWAPLKYFLHRLTRFEVRHQKTSQMRNH